MINEDLIKELPPMIEEARVGDTVRLTIVVEGVVADNEGLEVRGYELEFGPNRTIEILSRATPPLPSEPNTLHSDRTGDVWKVHYNGQLRCLSYPVRSETPNLYAPFRQLVLK